MTWPDDDARFRAEQAAEDVAALGPEYADLYLRASWLVATDSALNHARIGTERLSELGAAAERLCDLLHGLAIEGQADSAVALHLVPRGSVRRSGPGGGGVLTSS
jgi:hypothetical protein